MRCMFILEPDQRSRPKQPSRSPQSRKTLPWQQQNRDYSPFSPPRFGRTKTGSIRRKSVIDWLTKSKTNFSMVIFDTFSLTIFEHHIEPRTFITLIFSDVFHYSNIQLLDISKNQLTNLHPQTFKDLNHLKQIKLNDNPWVCSCQMSWFRQWVSEQEATHGKNIVKCSVKKRRNRTRKDVSASTSSPSVTQCEQKSR